MRRAALLVILALAPALAAAPSARAETLDFQRRACNGATVELAAQVEACGRLASSDRVDGATKAMAHYNAGVAYGLAKEWKQALGEFGRALAIDPENADAAFNRDVVQKIIDQPAQAPAKVPAQAPAKVPAQAPAQASDTASDTAADKTSAPPQQDATSAAPPATATDARAGDAAAELRGRQEITRLALPEDMRRAAPGAGKTPQAKQDKRAKTDRTVKPREKAKRTRQDRKKVR